MNLKKKKKKSLVVKIKIYSTLCWAILLLTRINNNTSKQLIKYQESNKERTHQIYMEKPLVQREKSTEQLQPNSL